MCGRYTAITPLNGLAELFDAQLCLPAEGAADAGARYNVAPTQLVAAVRFSHSRGQRILVLLRWGLIPSWAKDPSIGSRMINARQESVFDKPAFRAAIRRRRCLIPADGFYEWQRQAGRRKLPFYIERADKTPLVFAGIWERWHAAETPSGEATVIDSCAILTTAANAVVAPLHDRMPVIVEPADFARWLDPERQDPDDLRVLLEATPTAALTATPVSTWVNDPSHDDPRCVERPSDAGPAGQMPLL